MFEEALMREKPTPPEDYECCESGCSPCVWDLYYDDMREWQAEQAAQQDSAKTTESADNS